jgi:hypothetical protein
MNDTPQTAQQDPDPNDKAATVITRNIAVYPDQDAKVRLLAAQEFDGNYSAALRKMIRTYHITVPQPPPPEPHIIVGR